jgi:hypothetical protein
MKPSVCYERVYIKREFLKSIMLVFVEKTKTEEERGREGAG